MRIFGKNIEIPVAPGNRNLLAHLRQALKFRLDDHVFPIRFAITRSDGERYHSEVAMITDFTDICVGHPETIFRFLPRTVERTNKFVAVLLVPTGIGADIGGHAGDATPVARLLAATCDTLVMHPNVVNASDINEIPDNALYVEGSVICRLLMGTAGLQPVRANRILVIIDAHEHEFFSNAAINAVSAARASYGIWCPKVIQMDPPLRMRARYTPSGTAAGEIDGLSHICSILDDCQDEYDAVAIASVIEVPEEYHAEYFQSGGMMINPWGGVEAMLTHAISILYNVPSAHSPMLESPSIAIADHGVVDPRLAAEAVSLAFLHSILKGLHRSPKIVTDDAALREEGVLTSADVSCLVIPDGSLGLPTLAALEQNIPVIAIRENKNVMRNDLTALPWRPGQLYLVENYWEAAGVMTALKSGVAPESVRRPLSATRVEKTSHVKDAAVKKSAEGKVSST